VTLPSVELKKIFSDQRYRSAATLRWIFEYWQKASNYPAGQGRERNAAFMKHPCFWDNSDTLIIAGWLPLSNIGKGKAPVEENVM